MLARAEEGNRGKVRNDMRQQPSFYRLDRAAAGVGRERPESAPSMMVPLPPGWLCLQDCNLSGQLNQSVVVPFVLMHPDVGVALVDVSPVSNPEAESILRRRLEAARFGSIFPGFLPVLHLRLDRADLPATEAILRDAFAAMPPLSVGGGDGWVSVVRRALTPRDPARGPTHVQRPSRPIEPARAMDADELQHEAMASRDTAAQSFDTVIPESASRPTPPIIWVIMSGVGGLIAVLALFGLLNTGADTPIAAVEEPPSSPAVSAPPPPPGPAALPPSASAPPAPRPSAAPPLSPPTPSTTASLPTAPSAPPPSAATAPAPPPPPRPPDTSAGAPAPPAPAERPAAAAGRLPRVTVRLPANFRTGPDGQANILRVVPRGESFRVHGRTENGWVQVGDAEPRGWIHTSRLGEIE